MKLSAVDVAVTAEPPTTWLRVVPSAPSFVRIRSGDADDGSRKVTVHARMSAAVSVPILPSVSTARSTVPGPMFRVPM